MELQADSKGIGLQTMIPRSLYQTTMSKANIHANMSRNITGEGCGFTSTLVFKFQLQQGLGKVGKLLQLCSKAFYLSFEENRDHFFGKEWVEGKILNRDIIPSLTMWRDQYVMIWQTSTCSDSYCKKKKVIPCSFNLLKV